MCRVVNPSWIKCGWNKSSFPLVSMTHLDTLAGGKVPENFLNFQRYFSLENDVLECAYYFFHKETILSS